MTGTCRSPSLAAARLRSRSSSTGGCAVGDGPRAQSDVTWPLSTLSALLMTTALLPSRSIAYDAWLSDQSDSKVPYKGAFVVDPFVFVFSKGAITLRIDGVDIKTRDDAEAKDGLLVFEDFGGTSREMRWGPLLCPKRPSSCTCHACVWLLLSRSRIASPSGRPKAYIDPNIYSLRSAAHCLLCCRRFCCCCCCVGKRTQSRTRLCV